MRARCLVPMRPRIKEHIYMVGTTTTTTKKAVTFSALNIKRSKKQLGRKDVK